MCVMHRVGGFGNVVLPSQQQQAVVVFGAFAIRVPMCHLCTICPSHAHVPPSIMRLCGLPLCWVCLPALVFLLISCEGVSVGVCG